MAISTAPKFITFVLGAGSSFEVNMPTGADLKRSIASSLAFKANDLGRIVGGDQIIEAIHALAARPGARTTVNDYYYVAKLISAGLPQAPSIDNFIDSHRANALLGEIGKLAIASAILKAERQSTLYVAPTNIRNKLDFARVADTWFSAFFQLICLNCQEPDLPKRLASVRVISFNYDRTLEHYLFHSIQNYYGCSSERATEILSNLTILHPYGKVGSLPWQDSERGVPFGGDVHSSVLLAVSQNLRTFTERISEQQSQIDLIRDSVFGAEILTFLGFAYHELNLQLLFGPERQQPVNHARQVFGTAMGLSESNKRVISTELANLGRLDVSQITLRRELSAAQLLPEYSRSLRVPSTT
jgi:hypothetical protein